MHDDIYEILRKFSNNEISIEDCKMLLDVAYQVKEKSHKDQILHKLQTKRGDMR